MADTSTVWHVRPGTHFHWRQFDDEYVVYHRESGDTHLLNIIAAQTLRLLAASPADADELTGRVADALGLDADDELQRELRQLLADFDELGLIEPVDDDQGPDRASTG